MIASHLYINSFLHFLCYDDVWLKYVLNYRSFLIICYSIILFKIYLLILKHILEWESIRGQSNHLASIFAKDAHTETWVITQNTMLAVFYHGKIDKGWLNVLAEFFFFKSKAEQIPLMYTFLSPHWIDIAVFPWS